MAAASISLGKALNHKIDATGNVVVAALARAKGRSNVDLRVYSMTGHP
jgi:hypothetical protein